MGHRFKRRAVSALATATLLFVACGTEAGSGNDPDASPAPTTSAGTRTGPPARVTAASLERFDACPDLLRYLRDEGAKRVGPYGLPGGAGTVAMTATTDAVTSRASGAESSAASAPAPQAAGESDTAFSGTNVQESSVDEPDTVKTNGRHIFTTRPDGDQGRMRLVAVATNGGEPRLAGDVPLPEGAGTELLLAGNRLLAFGSSFSTLAARGGPVADIAVLPNGNARTIVGIVDVSDPARMRVTDVLRLEGSYASARMVGGVARLVLNTTSPERIAEDLEPPSEPTVSAERAALERNRRVMRNASLEALLPRFKLEDPSGNKRSEGALATCSSTFRPKTFSGFQTTSVVTIDPADPDPRNSAAVLGAAGIVYASTDNLYVATQNWPEAIPMVIDDPVGSTMPVQPDPAKTFLHRFDIGAANAVYAASGEVRGTVLNQWSMSEHDGHLRVATTEDAFRTTPEGVPASESFVTTFTASGSELERVGQVGKLGVGERIYGVRFIGDLGYVVTFRQIDPLHVVDLKDPAKPTVLGELKIPGYSAYLHPVGDGLLLGVGQDVQEPSASGEGGRQLGTQLSLFDVSDPRDPRRIDQVRVDDASSPVEWDHHAFTWWEPRRLAVVPISSYGSVVSSPGGREIAPREVEQLHAAIGYRVERGEIAEVGRADHARHVDDPGFGMISRSIVVGDEVYTVSLGGIMSSDLGSFAERGWVSLGG